MHVATMKSSDKKNNKILLTRQSPVMITPCKTIYNENLQKNQLTISYPVSKFDCANKSSTIEWEYIKSKEKTTIPTVIGGSINHSEEMKLSQFHFHWGPNNMIGSEHFINDESYSGELHLVHWNSSLYQTPEVAMSETDGILVIAIFIQVSDENQNFSNFYETVVFVLYYIKLPNLADPKY